MTPRLFAVILAGGRSRRMGRDKATLPWKGGTLLSRTVGLVKPLVEEVVVVTDQPALHAVPGARVVLDSVPFQGPLVALSQALRPSPTDRVLVLACDLPLLGSSLLMALIQEGRAHPQEAVVPLAGGERHPLCANYPGSIFSVMEERVKAGVTSMKGFLSNIQIRELSWSGPDMTNVNDPESFQRAQEGLE